MPIYTYQCKKCGVRFERKQHFIDTPLSTCPECNEDALRKVYTPVGIVFKGSGFYATDHRSPSGASRSTSESASEDKPSKSKEESKSSSDTSDDKKD